LKERKSNQIRSLFVEPVRPTNAPLRNQLNKASEVLHYKRKAESMKMIEE